MSYSPTPKPETTSIIGKLWTCLHQWELSVSLEESSMLMAEFISMYSLTSDDSFHREKLIYSMWEASTQTSSLLAALQQKLSTTQSKMATLLRAGWEDRAEIAILTLIRSGTRRHIADLLRNFCTFATNWLREISSEDFPRFEPTLTGNGLNFCTTINPQMLSLTRQRLRESMSGCHSLLLELGRAERGKWEWGVLRLLERGRAFGAKAPTPPRRRCQNIEGVYLANSCCIIEGGH